MDVENRPPTKVTISIDPSLVLADMTGRELKTFRYNIRAGVLASFQNGQQENWIDRDTLQVKWNRNKVCQVNAFAVNVWAQSTMIPLILAEIVDASTIAQGISRYPLEEEE